MHETPTERLPNTIKNYLPADITSNDALAIHQHFLNIATDTSLPCEHAMMIIAKASHSLQMMPTSNWPLMINFYLQDAKDRMAAPIRNINNAFNLLHTLCGLIIAAQKPSSPRLQHTIRDMETALAATLDWQNITIATHETDSIEGLKALLTLWEEEGNQRYTPILRRWLHLQISMSLYPFAGFGETLVDRATLMGMRMAMLKLALLSGHHVKKAPLEQDEIVRITQSIARILDHLADPTFSTQIAKDAGWHQEAQLHGLLLL